MTPNHLFSPWPQRGITLRNRIVVSPMCEYSSRDGFANDWHVVHLGSRAVGGAGLVFTEATAITPEGRISPDDLGIWSDEHIANLRRITDFVKAHGAAAGMQLAHAGRKASTSSPWKGNAPLAPADGGWTPVGPSPVAFDSGYPEPHELTRPEIAAIVEQFAAAAKRALTAGFQVVELHGAHGYLMNEFLSPLGNRRGDKYGGSLDGRMRFVTEVVEAVRAAWPAELPLWLRISASDWVEGGWTPADSVLLALRLGPLGVDVVDCSSGGNAAHAKIPVGSGYQTVFAEQVRREAGVETCAVGMITSAAQADHIIRAGQADGVALARELLRDPYFPLHAAHALGHAENAPWPVQYVRAKPRA